MGRQPCCDKIGLKRGPWTIDEDRKLMNFILNNGIQCWRLVPQLAGLLRCGKSCRLRWINYLRPDLKRGALTEAEEDMIIQLHSRYGNRWSKIASHFPGRTDNEIKNHWNTRIKKKLKHLGLDPVTHKPIEEKDIVIINDEETPKSENQENKSSELDSKDDYDDDRISKRDGISDIFLGENNISQMNSEMCENSNMRSNICDTGPYNEFSVDMSGQICDGFYQQWIDSPNNMFSWDSFSNFEEIFL